MDVKVEWKQPLLIGGLKRRLTLPENREFRIIQKLYGEWERRRSELTQAVPGRTFGVEIYPEGAAHFQPDTDAFDYLAGAEIAGSGGLPAGMDCFAAEAGLYAVFTHRGRLDDIGALIARIYGEWLPRSAYLPGGFDLEVYDERFLGHHNEASVMEVWVPVVSARPPHCGDERFTWTSAAQSLHEAIRHTEKKHLSLTEVMGCTGLAFRINIHEHNVDVAGPTAWDWGPELQKGLLNLGVRADYAGEPNHLPPSGELLERALGMIRRSVDRGIPAVGWDLFIPEFGVIRKYREETKELVAKDVSRDGLLPYAKLGRGQASELFVLTIEDSFEIDKTTALIGALTLILDHARRRYHRHPEPPYQNGLAAYDAWMRAFRERTVDPFGNAYNAALVCDARAYAAKFLRELPQQWDGGSLQEREVSRLAEQAAGHYQAVFDTLVGLPPLYPFPQGGHPNLPANADYSIGLLQRAKQAESRGVEALERMMAVLRG